MVRKINVHRKGYHRKPYTRKDGVKVSGSYVDSANYRTRDKGAPGHTPKSKQWFEPKRKSGFRKGRSGKQNLKVMLTNAPRNYNEDTKLRLAGRQAQGLANVTTDRATKRAAKTVQKLASKRLKELRK